MPKSTRYVWLPLATAIGLSGCSSAAPHVQRGTTAGEANIVGQSWDVCTWIGPEHERPGIYGTDLGISVPVPSAGQPATQLALLFGDTWAAQTDACAYPVMKADDLQATLPVQRPPMLTPGQPSAAAAQACAALHYDVASAADPTSWPRIHLYSDATHRDEEHQLDTGMLRTPIAAWNDDQHVFAAFIRDDAARCQASSDCPAQMICSADPAYTGKHIGGCAPQVSLSDDTDPRFCLSDDDCPTLSVCADLDTGLCLATKPFTVQRNGQSLSPSWYDDDPRRGIALRVVLATALWPERPQDYGTGFRFITNKFQNATVRSVAKFDPQQPENNDYSPGIDTLLMWGRPAFVAGKGMQALPFLLYQPLAGLLDTTTGTLHWAPHFFAGYDETGNPRWSEVEADAQPIYGVDENLAQQNGQLVWNWQSPEFDTIEQMSTSWLAPLQRWVMLYGGDPPAFAVADPKSGEKIPAVHLPVMPGAIYLRSAAHPWGRATQNADPQQGFGAPRPVLTREVMARHLACDDDAKSKTDCSEQRDTHSPGDLLSTLASWTTELTAGDWATVSASCIGGNAALGVQNSLSDDSSGHLYGANIIEPWSEDVTARTSGLVQGQRAVELYWNVSTWNPYEVLLIKTQLRGGPAGLE
jgi:hypothetical protein